MARVFLSHNHKDKHFVNRLARDLKKHGVHVWIDEAELDVGDSLFKKIENAIAEVDYLAAIISKNSVNSEWVQRELEIAFSREIYNKRLFVIPIIIDDCEIPGFLRGRVYADFKDLSKYEETLSKILQRLGAKRPLPPSPPAEKGKMPFAIPVYAYRGDTDTIYHYIGSIPSNEDGLYVNMIYLLLEDIVVDLIIPGAVYEVYQTEIFSKYHIETDLYSDDLGWIEVYLNRKRKTPQEIEKECLSIISKHNEQLRWLLYFADRK